MAGQDQHLPIEASTRVQHAQRNSLTDFRLQSSHSAQPSKSQGPMAVPNGQHRISGSGQPFQGGHMQRPSVGGGFGGGAFDMPRSPPHDKNTAHVPCKFFRLGKCTYGVSCPFEHSRGDATETAPCKYFAKGNCKFGQKCALAHILPDGRRINGPNHGMEGQFTNGNGGGGGGRGPQNQYVDVPQGMYRPSNIALQRSAAGQQYEYTPEEPMYIPGMPQPIDSMSGMPRADNGYSSHQQTFGSPKPELKILASSPQGARALDAPLPPSFDVNGVSIYARNGPAAASVPTGWLRASPASPAAPLAFGNLDRLTLGDLQNSSDRHLMATSPPSSAIGEGFYAARRGLPIGSHTKPKMIAASFDTRHIWKPSDDDETIEEDLVPTDLGLLTDEEKVRRFSRTDQDSGTRISAVGSPTGSKVGSPSTASPSRYGTFFARRNDGETLGAAGASPFGHVGSPLRKLSMTAQTNALPTFGDASSHVSSPPRTSGMGMISQQRMRLGSFKSEAPTDMLPPRHPGTMRTTSTTSVASTGAPSRLSRAISSSSVGRDKIDEENIFTMEEEDQHSSSYGAPNIWKMMPDEKPLPNLGPIGGLRRSSAKEIGR